MKYGKATIKQEAIFMFLFTALCCIVMSIISAFFIHANDICLSIALLCAGSTGGYTITKSTAFRSNFRGKLWMIAGLLSASTIAILH